MILTPLCRALAVFACLLLAAPALSATTEAVGEPVDEPAAEAAAEPAPSFAPEVADLAVARILVDAGRFVEALAILQPLAQDHPDHPNRTDVLFLLGLAATQTALLADAPEERRELLLDLAIASYRVILINSPELVRVRLELARAFFLKGEDNLSQRHFERVLAGNPPEPVVANVRSFLNQIRARRRWSMHVGAAIAPDSNIGGTSGEEIIYIYDFPFQRGAQDLETSGVGLSVWGGGEYQYPLGDSVRLRTGADFSRREHKGSAFDETFLSVHAGPRVLVDENTEASLLLSASQRWTATAVDHHALGGRIEVGHRVNRAVTVNGRVSLQDRRHRLRTSFDGPVMDVSLGGAWVITPTVRAHASVGYGRERPRTERERHVNRRVGGGVSVILPLGFTVGGGGELRWTDYEPGWFPFVTDGGPREDRTWSVRASVYNRAITLYGFSPQVAVVHEVRKTNAQLHGYERTRGELRFVQQF